MLLDYKKVYLVSAADAEEDAPRTLAIAPRAVNLLEPALQYLVDADTPGANAHSILHPVFEADDDGSILVLNDKDDSESWRFEELTLENWERYVRPGVDAEYAQQVYKAVEAGINIQQYYRDQRVDEEAWPENP